MKKKVFFCMLVVLLAFGFTGCNDDSGINDSVFTVEFDLDGGNIYGNTASIEVEVKSGETIEFLPNPQKAHNNFGGWFFQKNGDGTQFTSSTSVTFTLTVYAKWIPIEFSVTFDSNGGSDVPAITGIISGSTITLPQNPSNEGNIFSGWYTDNVTFLDIVTPSTATITESITLFARWQPWLPSAWEPPNEGLVSSLGVLHDDRFSGVFIGTRTLASIDVLYENRLISDGTNRFHYFSATSRNGILESQPSQFFYEIEINTDDKYRRRLWNNQYSNWSEWFDYRFEGERLTIQWLNSMSMEYNKHGVITMLNQYLNQRIIGTLISDFSEEEIYLLEKEYEEKLRKESIPE